jgi:16S rRNA (cytosine1402-N4)-methyltransferase
LAPTSLTCSSLARGESKHGLVHKPVLLSEVIEQLMIKEDGVYVDATFGRGGHVQGILRHLGPKGLIYTLDKDPEAIKAAKLIKDKRLRVKQGSFTTLLKWIKELDLVGKVNGILLDLGVSSPQLEKPERGFSFLREGPLDMRMDPTHGQDAASWVNRASYEEIAEVLKTYGEERFYKKIARAIMQAREVAPIKTTTQLADIVAKANPKWEKYKHPATRTFQAIRIFINNELQELRDCLMQCLEILSVGGRLLVISFHSLEDRIVKQFIQEQLSGGLPSELPIKKEQLAVRLKRINGAIKPKEQEVSANPRARSAKLRVVEKIL